MQKRHALRRRLSVSKDSSLLFGLLATTPSDTQQSTEASYRFHIRGMHVCDEQWLSAEPCRVLRFAGIDPYVCRMT
jgi:hypothetical protein